MKKSKGRSEKNAKSRGVPIIFDSPPRYFWNAPPSWNDFSKKTNCKFGEVQTKFEPIHCLQPRQREEEVNQTRKSLNFVKIHKSQIFIWCSTKNEKTTQHSKHRVLLPPCCLHRPEPKALFQENETVSFILKTLFFVNFWILTKNWMFLVIMYNNPEL